jgi:hypothetical protein
MRWLITIFFLNFCSYFSHCQNFREGKTTSTSETTILEKKVSKGESIKNIIMKNYGVKYAKNDSTYINLYNTIAIINNLKNPDLILENATIFLPVDIVTTTRTYSLSIPKKGRSLASVDLRLGQHDITADNFKIANEQRVSSVTNALDFKKTGSDAKTELGFFNLINSLYQPQNLKYYINKVRNNLGTIHISSDSLINKDSTFMFDDTLNIDVKDLSSNYFNEFYIFDVFKTNEKCTHGNMVEQVVKETLAHYKLDSIFSKVKTAPINYFSNKKYGDSIYRVYERKNDFDSEQTNHSGNDSVIYVNNPNDSLLNNDEKTPELYLNALVTCISDSTPDIITNSYTVDCSSPTLTPSDNGITNYFAAALNDDRTIEEAYKIKHETGSLFLFREPFFSYIGCKQDIGTIIVGNQVSNNVFKGMCSTDGLNVNVLGKGRGWGYPKYDECFSSTEVGGTSFATPQVATKLFIAKAYWRKNDLSITSLDARRRLLLASELNPVFVNKFSSGGCVNINKLLQIKSGFLVSNNNIVTPIDSIKDAFISYSDLGDSYLSDVDFTPDDPLKLSGLYISNGRVFIFPNTKGQEKWLEIHSLKNFTLAYYENNSFKFLDLKDFISTYKEFVYLKKNQ